MALAPWHWPRGTGPVALAPWNWPSRPSWPSQSRLTAHSRPPSARPPALLRRRLQEPDVAYNFVYRPPGTAVERFFKYFVRDPHNMDYTPTRWL